MNGVQFFSLPLRLLYFAVGTVIFLLVSLQFVLSFEIASLAINGDD